jgi:hypothetical protein
VDGPVLERLRQGVVDEPVLLDERKPLETTVHHGDVEVVAPAGPVDDRQLGGARKGRAEELLEPFAHRNRRYQHGTTATILGGMRRLIGVTIVSTLLVLGTAGPAAAIPGPEAKEWAAKIARLGQRPAGGLNERRAGEIVRRRLATLGYDVTIQRFRLPNGQMSRNVVGRTSGPVRVIIVAHMDGVHGTQAANDNASGVGVMLTVARFLAAEDGVLVAAMGAEERMVTGSSWHLGSRRLTSGFSAAQKAGVRLALSVDMVGFGTTLNIRGLESSPNHSARRLLNSARARDIRAFYLRDTGQSDHDDLTRGGIPAAWIEWRWDTCWHQPCDRIDRLRPNKLRDAGRVVLGAARAVVQ